MPSEPRKSSEEIHEATFGSLRDCLVGGNQEQQNRERRVRRRALVISISIQSVVLVALVIVPLFGRTESIVGKDYVPIPPYSPYRTSHERSGGDPSRGPKNACHFCVPPTIPTVIVTHDGHRPTDGSDENIGESLLPGIPGAPDGLIPIGDSRTTPRPPRPAVENQPRPSVVHVTTIDPAMLQRRVEPSYPPLARQIHKEGKVELRAVIATDGTIQSLEIVGGDPIFYLSAKEAVSQWRYRPTILNGQPVEVDTYITVIYTMQH